MKNNLDSNNHCDNACRWVEVNEKLRQLQKRLVVFMDHWDLKNWIGLISSQFSLFSSLLTRKETVSLVLQITNYFTPGILTNLQLLYQV